MKDTQCLASLFLILCGCSNKPTDNLSANGYSDSAVTTLHNGDSYTIERGRVEIHAVCRYTTYSIKGQDKTWDDHCLKALPVGQPIRVKRGEGDWLFADWEVDNTQWHMGLSVEKEAVK